MLFKEKTKDERDILYKKKPYLQSLFGWKEKSSPVRKIVYTLSVIL